MSLALLSAPSTRHGPFPLLGTKINDGPAIDRLGLDRNRLARLSVESYLQQILRHGFFHADPVCGAHLCIVREDSAGGCVLGGRCGERERCWGRRREGQMGTRKVFASR